jgi:hypothetical protein
MSPEFQSVAALVIVALAAGWLAVRAFGKRKNSGCGGECACPAEKLKR